MFEEIYQAAYQAGAQELFGGPAPRAVRRTIDRFLEQYPLLPVDTQVIDFGCGEGAVAVYLAQRGFSVTGVDISAAAISRAQTVARRAQAVVHFRVTDALDLQELPGARFDWGLNIGCLHMIVRDEDRRRHLKEMWRVMKPGGLLLSINELARRAVHIKDPDRYLQSFLAVDEAKQVDVAGGKVAIEYKGVGFRRASTAQYRREFEDAGFDVLKTEIFRLEPLWRQVMRRGMLSNQRFLVLCARKLLPGHQP
ncbi:MAG: methyltransferase domain-containing protein [Acidobacteria bacterium]|nr:methyltransferase domain-containing protein [Acidobacteriota bacterium]MBI3657612.1 methyltransferase domain-containing protein [Acidobacteriota bacterium]